MVSDEGPWFAFVTAPSEHHRPMLGRMFGILKGGGDIPEPNTGVMAVSSCDGSRRVTAAWSEVYWHGVGTLTGSRIDGSASFERYCFSGGSALDGLQGL